MNAPTTPNAPVEIAARRLPFSNQTAIAVGVALAAAGLGAWWLALPAWAETTDDAYVQADSSIVAPRIRGFVAALLVRDNQSVKAGQPLARIDPEEFDTRLASARADLAAARAEAEGARAALTRQGEEERLAIAAVAEARAAIAAAVAQHDRADNDARRYASLLKSGAVSAQSAETSHAAAISARSDVERVRAALAVAERQQSVTAARRADLVAAIARADAIVAQRSAALDLARQDLGHSLIRAPIAGMIGNRQANIGDYVQPGTRLMTVVPVGALYVTANFKETQTGRMLPGQRATVKVDALHGPAFTGHVDSIAPGSGATFALLPYEPGTGNFTKIVQRVPVRIVLDPGQSGLDRLRPGLSVTVRVELN